MKKGSDGAQRAGHSQRANDALRLYREVEGVCKRDRAAYTPTV